MPVRFSPRTIAAATCLSAALACGLAGCERSDRPVDFADLNAAEARYVQRVVVLERAKAFALTDRAAGDALLDSLAGAWGDSALDATARGIPREPQRAAAVAHLIERILDAERDSLVYAPRADRLTAPLPVPAPPREDGPE
jgi:hypothetical protein